MRVLAILIISSLFSAIALNAEELFDNKTISVGQTYLDVQIAKTDLAREKGLMNRKKVAPYDGMLFIFQYPRQASFWMKNTTLALEIGYFNQEGILVEIHEMTPLSTQQIISLGNDILYALELPKGDFDRLGINIGQKLFIP